MLPWKRKEVFNGFSFQNFTKVQKILEENGISFHTRTVDSSRARGIFTESRYPAPFVNREVVCQYYVYVAPQDYEFAKHLLNR